MLGQFLGHGRDDILWHDEQPRPSLTIKNDPFAINFYQLALHAQLCAVRGENFMPFCHW